MRWFFNRYGDRAFLVWLWSKGWAHRLKPGTKVIHVRGWRTALLDEGYQRICCTWLFSWEKL